jgi:chromosome segregation ATPase
MARGIEVTPPSKPISKTNNLMGDLDSLKIKEEIVATYVFISNMQGETKKHVDTLLGELAHANDLLDLKERFERENADEISSLTQALEEEQELRVALEERLSSLEDEQNEIIRNLTKERDHAIALSTLLKKEKVEFGVGHARLTKDLEKLDKAHKALESEFSSLSKSHEQLKIRLTKYDVPSSSTPSCDHANVIEENTRLKAKLTKSFPSQGEKTLDDLLSN